MEKQFYHTLRLGILGGGQLGKMLLQKAADFNLSTAVLDPDENAPARFLTEVFAHGSFADYDAVYNFGKTVDLLTIEIEHVNVDALDQLEKEGLRIYPEPRVIRMVQDKAAQKIFYRTHGIPTATFHLISHRDEIKNHLDFLPCIQKLRKGGYDGKGVLKLKDEASLPMAFEAPSLLEQAIDIDKEIAILVARNSMGEIKSYPAVEMEFNPEANLVEFLFAPASLPESKTREAQLIAEQLIGDMNMTGLLAVEFFLTRQGEWLVNEIAPRPHNSGHHTIEAAPTSQYEQHLRAILGLPLGSTKSISPAVMINILGEKNANGPAHYDGLEKVLREDGVCLHLYGKKTVKPFRKMGHITVLDPDLQAAKKKARKVKNQLKVIAR